VAEKHRAKPGTSAALFGGGLVENPKSEIRNPKSEIRNPKSEIRNPKSEIRNFFVWVGVP
jgi:hypothetical protein